MLVRAALLSLATLACGLLGAPAALADPDPLPAQVELMPSPAQVQFGAVGIHFGGSAQQSVLFTNQSLASAIVMSVSVGGSDASDFQLVYDECSGRTIEPENSCKVEIRFQPSERGEADATLTLETHGGEGPIEVPLSGSGSTGTLSANPSSLRFSAIPYTRGNREESQSENEQVNIETHEAGVQIGSVSIVGPDASSFSVQYGDCENGQFSSNNQCDVGIRFQPSSTGDKHAQLVIDSDSQAGPLVVPLEGEGLFGPKISVESTEALLGEVPIGSTASHTFTVTNSGDYPLFIQQSFLVSGTPHMFPQLSNTCTGQVVMPEASCEFTVGFEPTTPGEKDASLIFVTNATPQINVLGIDGVGVLPLATPTPAPLELAHGAVQASAPPAPKRTNATASHLLTFEQESQLYSSVGNDTVDTGISAQCPATVSKCRTESIVTAHVPSRGTKAASLGAGHTIVLLGYCETHLGGGQRIAVRIPLSSRAVALLKRYGHLRTTIDLVIHSGGKIIADRARTITLTAPAPAA